MSSFASLSDALVSLIKENLSEPKTVLIDSMVSLLLEEFDFMSQSDALMISVKAYEKAILL